MEYDDRLKTLDDLLQLYATAADAYRARAEIFAETASLPEADLSVSYRPDDDGSTFELRAVHGRLPPGALHAHTCDEEKALLALRRLGRFDRAAVRAGVSRRLSVGDPAFDEAVYVLDDADETWVRSALGAAEARQAALALIAAGFEVRFHDAGRVIVSASRAHRPKKPLPPAGEVRAWLQHLLALSAAVARLPPSDPGARGHRARLGAPLPLLFASMAAFVGSFLGPAGPHTARDPGCDDGICLACAHPVVGGTEGNVCFWQSPPSHLGLLAGAAIALGIVLFYARRVRGKSNAHVELATAITLPALFFFLSGMGLGSTVDALLFGR